MHEINSSDIDIFQTISINSESIDITQVFCINKINIKIYCKINGK